MSNKEKRISRKDLKKKPFRGIYSEIAKEVGMSPQGVMKAIWEYENVKLRKMMIEKCEQRKATHKRTHECFTNIFIKLIFIF